MRIYFASQFRAFPVVLALKAKFEAAGHHIVSTWHDKEALNLAAVGEARKDIAEINTAQVFVILTTDCELTRGGLWFEMGYAYSAALQIIILGPRINVFCFLQDDVKQVDTDEACLEAVAQYGQDLAECDTAMAAASRFARLQTGDASMEAAL